MCKEEFLCCITTSLHKVDMSNVPICTNYKYVVGNKKNTGCPVWQQRYHCLQYTECESLNDAKTLLCMTNRS